jgi:8-oxo-dGTP pyrophosphatase MutT (NUDIX family)
MEVMQEQPDPIQVTRSGVTKGFGHALVCSGYLVEDGKVLLVHHNVFNKWVPPGGHIEAGDTFSDAAAREVLEETGLDVEVLSTTPSLIDDDNATPLPGPFYVDMLTEGFKIPPITQYFYVRRKDRSQEISTQIEEVHEVRWFTAEEIETIPTFEQVRVLCRYALENHPDA